MLFVLESHPCTRRRASASASGSLSSPDTVVKSFSVDGSCGQSVSISTSEEHRAWAYLGKQHALLSDIRPLRLLHRPDDATKYFREDEHECLLRRRSAEGRLGDSVADQGEEGRVKLLRWKEWIRELAESELSATSRTSWPEDGTHDSGHQQSGVSKRSSQSLCLVRLVQVDF